MAVERAMQVVRRRDKKMTVVVGGLTAVVVVAVLNGRSEVDGLGCVSSSIGAGEGFRASNSIIPSLRRII